MRYIPDVKTAGLAALCNDCLVMWADSLSVGMLYILCWAMCDTVGGGCGDVAVTPCVAQHDTGCGAAPVVARPSLKVF